MIISNFPPCNIVSDLAIESPSPLPSVVLDTSPLTNLSVSSSGFILSGFSEIFFITNVAILFSEVISI